MIKEKVIKPSDIDITGPLFGFCGKIEHEHLLRCSVSLLKQNGDSFTGFVFPHPYPEIPGMLDSGLIADIGGGVYEVTPSTIAKLYEQFPATKPPVSDPYLKLKELIDNRNTAFESPFLQKYIHVIFEGFFEDEANTFCVNDPLKYALLLRAKVPTVADALKSEKDAQTLYAIAYMCDAILKN